MKTLYKHIFVLCLLAIFVAGCGRVGNQDKREQKSKIMLKAYEMSNAGDYDSAIALFSKALETYPTLARPHLDIALLLHDYKHEYVDAIYHYKRYLIMRPRSEKADMIGARIKQSERAFVTSRVAVDKTSGLSLSELIEKNTVLEKKNESLKNKVEELEGQLAGINENIRQEYMESVVGAEKTVESNDVVELPKPQPQVDPIDTTPEGLKLPEVKEPEDIVVTSPEDIVVKTPRVKPPKPVKKATEKPKTYTVMRGDSLSEIAYKVYGDPTQWRKIQKANQDTLGENGVNVKVGQVLTVPAP